MESSGEKGLHSLPASCLKPKACWSVHWRVKLAPEASLKVRRASMATFPPARQLWATLGAIFFPHVAIHAHWYEKKLPSALCGHD